MRNTNELSRYLRFRLSQLSVENAHHRFEELCRQFARQRICDRILPATGPVGSGGDQGLDFESYRTYLQHTPIIGSCYVGEAGQDKLGFAVSLQKAIVPKIKKDIKTICSGPTTFTAVYYFCENDLDIAKRHRIQAWAKSEFDVELEIFDGQAISELLIDPTLFWIAIEYLSIPGDLYPRSQDTDERYNIIRNTWLLGSRSPVNFADFAQVKQGLRQAKNIENLRPDLPAWISKMKEFDAAEFPNTIRRKAIYEICVAALRGQNNLTVYLPEMRNYFTALHNGMDISELDDVANLVVYCTTAQRLHHLDVKREEVESWLESAISCTMEKLKISHWPEAKARLLQIRGQLALAEIFLLNPDSRNQYFSWWNQMLLEVEKAPLFPLERFADQLTVFASVEGNDPTYLEITSKTDELLVRRTGGFTAAEKCRDRALAMFENENYIGAISQLHRAKIKWFAAETLRGSLLAMELLGDCYQRLGLVYPAKYYWTGVIMLAMRNDKEKYAALIVRCLARTANICYFAGEWLDFLNIAETAFIAENVHLPPEEQEPVVSDVYQHMVLVRGLTHQFSPEQDSSIASLIVSALGGSEEYKTLLPNAADDYNAILKSNTDEIWSLIQNQLAGRPLCDAGEERSISFRALGIEWILEFQNGFHHTLCAETLASCIQVALVELSSDELLLLPVNVKVRIELIGGDQHVIERMPDNDLIRWKLLIPLKHLDNADSERKVCDAAIETLLYIFYECSVLPDSQLSTIIDKKIKDDLYGKTFFLGSYGGTFSQRWSVELFNRVERRYLKPLGMDRPFTLRENERMPWNDSNGPGYSSVRATQFIENRYEIPLRAMRVTLPRLLEDRFFKSTLCRLREEGLLDWELLVIVASIVSDERAKQKFEVTALNSEISNYIRDLMYEEETEDLPPVDPSVFTYERCRMQHRINQMGVAHTWGLEVRQQTPAMDALKKLLDVRYHQRKDDIEHDIILEC